MIQLSEKSSSSGLDIESIVKQLVSIERKPLDVVNSRQASVATKLGAFSTLRASLSDLKSAASPLRSFSFFQSKSATSSDPLSVAVSVSDASSVTAGSSTVNQVVTLANAQKLNSSIFTASDAMVGTGQLKIKVGSSSEISIAIEAEQSRLTGIRDKINAADAGVIASVIKSKDQVYKLVLQASKTGVENEIQIDVIDDDGDNQDRAGLSQLRYTPKLSPSDDIKNLTESQPPQDAVFILDGEELSRSSNTISDAISGLTLTLIKKTNADADIVMNRSANTSIVKGQIETFVLAYNQAILGLKEAQIFDPNTKTGGPLLGNITAQAIYNRLQSLPHQNVPDLEGAFKSLSDIGIALNQTGRFGSDGTLTIDSSKLDKVLQKDLLAVGRVFARFDKTIDPKVQIPTSGIADQFEKAILGIADGRSGRILAAEKGLLDANNTFEKERLRLEIHIDKFEKKTRKKFANLKVALSRIQGIGSAFDRQIQQLENISNFVQKRNRIDFSER
ncbi:MAG: flagellar filament capping protein FliD [Nitrospirota bacterium]